MHAYPCLRLAALVVLMTSVSSSASEARRWPANFDPYVQPTGNCLGLTDVPELPPMPTGPDRPVTLEYVAFLKEEMCRTQLIRSALAANPDRLCPGVTPASFPECYSKVVQELTTKPGLDVNGFMVMHSIALSHFSRNRSAFDNPNEAKLNLVEMSWSSLDLFEKRIRAESFAAKVSPPSTRARSETEELRKMDEWASQQYATRLLSQSEKIVSGVEADTPRLRSQLERHRKKLTLLASRWNFKLNPAPSPRRR